MEGKKSNNSQLAGLERKLDRYGGVLDQHTKTLARHEKILNEHSQILNKHSKILNEHGQILADQSEQLVFLRENMVSRREYLEGQDQVVTMLKDIKQEMSFTYGWLRRHDDDIYRIKQRLQMA